MIKYLLNYALSIYLKILKIDLVVHDRKLSHGNSTEFFTFGREMGRNVLLGTERYVGKTQSRVLYFAIRSTLSETRYLPYFPRIFPASLSSSSTFCQTFMVALYNPEAFTEVYDFFKDGV